MLNRAKFWCLKLLLHFVNNYINFSNFYLEETLYKWSVKGKDMINVPNINQSAKISNTGTITQQTQSVPANASQQNNTPNYTATIYPNETVSVYNPDKNNPKLTHTSWFYINDVHGKMTNMERIYNISKEFDSTPSNVMSPQFFKNSKHSVCDFIISSSI